MIHLLHGWPTAAYPIIIRLLGFLPIRNVVSARFVFAVAMPPAPEIAEV